MCTGGNQEEGGGPLGEILASRIGSRGSDTQSGALGDIGRLATQAQEAGAGPGAIPLAEPSSRPDRYTRGDRGDRLNTSALDELSRRGDRGDRIRGDRNVDPVVPPITAPGPVAPPVGADPAVPGIPGAPGVPATPAAPPPTPWQAPPNPFAGMFPPELLFGWGGPSEQSDALRQLLGKYVSGVPPVAAKPASVGPRAGAVAGDRLGSAMDTFRERSADRGSRRDEYRTGRDEEDAAREAQRELRRRGGSAISAIPDVIDPVAATGATAPAALPDDVTTARRLSDRYSDGLSRYMQRR